jgi:hypothetical protein
MNSEKSKRQKSQIISDTGLNLPVSLFFIFSLTISGGFAFKNHPYKQKIGSPFQKKRHGLFFYCFFVSEKTLLYSIE